jgi:hypothetical protein
MTDEAGIIKSDIFNANESEGLVKDEHRFTQMKCKTPFSHLCSSVFICG